MALSIGNLSPAGQYQEDAIAVVGVSQSAKENPVFKQERTHPFFLETIVGHRGGLCSVLAQVKVAPTNATVLITGETGMGKEVIARAVDELTPRRTRNLVTLNCAAVCLSLNQRGRRVQRDLFIQTIRSEAHGYIGGQRYIKAVRW